MASPTPLNTSRWLPLVCWIQETGALHTRINIFPSGFTRDPKDEFVSTFRFYEGSNQVVAEYTTPPVTMNRPLKLEIGDVMREAGLATLDGVAEIMTRQVGTEPPTPRFLEVWCDIYSDDHRVDVSAPAVPIAGSIKVPFAGQYRYQLYPGVLYSKDVQSDVVVLNPYSRPIEVALQLLNARGQQVKGPMERIAPHGYIRWDFKRVTPDPVAFFAPSGIGSAIVSSSFKLLEFVLGTRTGPEGSTTWYDHMVPFIESTYETRVSKDDLSMNV